MRITFHVPAVPVAQPRQRQRVIQSKGGKPFAHNYTPAKHPVNAYKAAVQLAASGAYGGPPLEGPVAVSLLYVMPRPSNKTWRTKAMPREWYVGRVDRDNLEKATLDALSKILWRDDRQVCSGPTQVVIADGREQPHVEIVVESLEGRPPAGL